MSEAADSVVEGTLVVDLRGRVVRGDATAAAALGLSPGELAGRMVTLDGVEGVALDDTSLLGLFAELSSVALFGFDAAFRITLWNRGAERIFGYREQEIAGQTIEVLVPAHLRDDVERVERRVASGERVDRVFTEIQRRDGMPIPVALSMSPLASGDDVLGGGVVVAQELTEIRLAQAALAEVEQRFREWEALAHVGRWLWDVGSGVVQWSDEMHRMHGVDPRDFDGTLDGHLAVIHPDDRDRIRDETQGAVTSGQPFEHEYRLAGDDSPELVLVMRAEPTVGSSGEVVGLRGVSHAAAVSAAQRSA